MRVAVAVGLAMILYAVLLGVVSYLSRVQVVALGGTMPVCPPLAQCPVTASVAGYEIGPGRDGTLRYFVRVAYTASPAQPDTVALSPRAEVWDDVGARLRPIREVPPVRIPPGGRIVMEYRFEQVFPLVAPKLRLTDGSPWRRALGAVVVGEWESVGHAPRLLSLQ